MLGLGTTELLVIGGILVLLFGAKKIPQLGGSIAEGIKNFQKGLSGQDKDKIVDDSKPTEDTDKKSES